jgi:hypothetical protein
LAKKPAYMPTAPREIFEASRRHLRSKVETPNPVKAEQQPRWKLGEAPGTEYAEIAEMGDLTLYAVRTTPEAFKTAPPGTLRVSWCILSEKEDDVIAGGGADSIEDAKEYAHLCYQAAYGVIKGGDA